MPEAPAMTADTTPDWGAIRVRGARENNLKDINLDIPKRRLTVFTGVSGSGKSSLVFETIAAEVAPAHQRDLHGVRPGLHGHAGAAGRRLAGEPDRGNRRRPGAHGRQRPIDRGTVTDAHAMLRIIFSRLGKPNVGPSTAFSFNVPAGSIRGEITLERGKGECGGPGAPRSGRHVPRLRGPGQRLRVDVEQLVDRDKAWPKALSTSRNSSSAAGRHRIFAGVGLLRPRQEVARLHRRRAGSASCTARTRRSRSTTSTSPTWGWSTASGAPPRQGRESLQPHIRAAVERIATSGPCPACGGIAAECDRPLVEDQRPEHRRRHRHADHRAGRLAAQDRAPAARADGRPAGRPPRPFRDDRAWLPEPRSRVLDACPAGSRSGREMVRHLGSALTDVTYVFDEPTIGLHAHDVQQMNHLLQRLRDKGNTVLVVEHEPDVMAHCRPRRRHGAPRRHARRRGRLRGTVRRARGLRHADRRAPRRCASRSRRTSGRRPARSRSGTPGCTTSGTSRSTCRSASLWR